MSSTPAPQNGFALQDFRLKAKLTGDQAAVLANMSPSHLRNMEHGRRAASVAHLEALAEIYDVRVASLLRHDSPTGREAAQNGFACRDFRIKAKFTVDQAAALADISAPHLRNIEHEHRSASDLHLERLAAIYEVRVNSLRRQPVSLRVPVPA